MAPMVAPAQIGRVYLIANDGEHDITDAISLAFTPALPTVAEAEGRPLATSATYTATFTMAPGAVDRLLALFGTGRYLSAMHAAYHRKTARRNRRRR